MYNEVGNDTGGKHMPTSWFAISIGKCRDCSYFHLSCATRCWSYQNELWQMLTKKADGSNRFIQRGRRGSGSPYLFYVRGVSKDAVLPSREELLAEIVQFNIAHPEFSGIDVYVRHSCQ